MNDLVIDGRSAGDRKLLRQHHKRPSTPGLAVRCNAEQRGTDAVLLSSTSIDDDLNQLGVRFCGFSLARA